MSSAPMGVGLLVSLTLPGAVLLLVAVAVGEQVWARISGTKRPALSASGMDVVSAALDPGRAIELDEQRSRTTVRVDARDAAPPYGRVDPASGVVVLEVPER